MASALSKGSKCPRASLASLPDELLALIVGFEHLRLADLVALSHTCRRLNAYLDPADDAFWSFHLSRNAYASRCYLSEASTPYCLAVEIATHLSRCSGCRGVALCTKDYDGWLRPKTVLTLREIHERFTSCKPNPVFSGGISFPSLLQPPVYGGTLSGVDARFANGRLRGGEHLPLMAMIACYPPVDELYLRVYPPRMPRDPHCSRSIDRAYVANSGAAVTVGDVLHDWCWRMGAPLQDVGIATFKIVRGDNICWIDSVRRQNQDWQTSETEEDADLQLPPL